MENTRAEYTRRMPPPRYGYLKTLFVLIVLLVAANGVILLIDPWSVHIGGRWKPLLYWSGSGKLVTNGGTYPLYVSFFPSTVHTAGGSQAIQVRLGGGFRDRVAIALAGAVAYNLLPVSPLPRVDFPTISVQATLPGASPETMASSVAAPLERQFGRIAAVSEMTSTSTLGGTGITLQFELNRDINAAARDVEAALNAARGYLPSNLPNNPGYRKVNPSESSIFQIALTSDVLDRGQLYDAASAIIVQKLSQIRGIGQVYAQGSALPSVRVELNPMALNKYGIGLEQVRGVLYNANANIPKGIFRMDSTSGKWARTIRCSRPSSMLRCSLPTTTARRYGWTMLHRSPILSRIYATGDMLTARPR